MATGTALPGRPSGDLWGPSVYLNPGLLLCLGLPSVPSSCLGPLLLGQCGFCHAVWHIQLLGRGGQWGSPGKHGFWLVSPKPYFSSRKLGRSWVSLPLPTFLSPSLF